MALPFSLEAKLDEFVDELVNQPPCLLGAFGKSKAHEKKSYDVIKLEDMESTPSTTTDEAVISHEEVTPMCSSSATSISDSPRTPWRDLLPMKVPMPTCWKEMTAPSSSSPMHVKTKTGSKSPEVSTDATREHCVSSSLPALAAWAASEARAGQFTCLSTTPEVRPAPFSPTFSTPSWPVPPPFDAPTLPPGLERPVPPLPPPPQAAEVELAPRRRAGKAGQFLCRFVFTGFDAANHADFELVPRLIGRKGCNLRPISQACRGKIRVSGWDGSQPMGKYGTMDTPVEVTLSCHNQEDLDEGIKQLTTLLEDLRNHFSRYCYKRGISPVPELFHLLP